MKKITEFISLKNEDKKEMSIKFLTDQTFKNKIMKNAPDIIPFLSRVSYEPIIIPENDSILIHGNPKGTPVTFNITGNNTDWGVCSIISNNTVPPPFKFTFSISNFTGTRFHIIIESLAFETPTTTTTIAPLPEPIGFPTQPGVIGLMHTNDINNGKIIYNTGYGTVVNLDSSQSITWTYKEGIKFSYEEKTRGIIEFFIDDINQGYLIKAQDALKDSTDRTIIFLSEGGTSVDITQY